MAALEKRHVIGGFCAFGPTWFGRDQVGRERRAGCPLRLRADTLLNAAELPLRRAAIELNRGNPAQAIES